MTTTPELAGLRLRLGGRRLPRACLIVSATISFGLLGGGFGRLGVEQRFHLVAHHARRDLAGAHGGEQILKLLEVQVVRDFGKGARRAGRGYAKASLAQVFCKCVATRNGIVVFGCPPQNSDES